MNAQNYTQKSLEAIQNAQKLTIDHANQQIEQIHLLAALLKQENGLVPQLLKKMGLTPESLEAAVDAVLANPRYCGVTLWQMIDCKSFVNSGQIRCKPRGFNCAGLLDEYRRPKLAFDTVKRLFRYYSEPDTNA